MSTKIYYGFSIATKDLNKVLKLVRSYRTKHWVKDARALKLKFLRACLSGSVEHMGRSWTPEENQTRALKAEQLWWDLQREQKQNGIRNRAIDTSFEIVLFPLQKRVIGIAYTDHDEWFQKFLTLPGVSEYAYYDNTDEPEGITYAAWKRRGKVWDRVLPGAGIPSMEGFTVSIADPDGPEYIPASEVII